MNLNNNNNNNNNSKKKNDDERKKILFDSVSFHFSISVFIYQFLLNLTYPLFLPFSFYRYGWIFLYSQGFTPSSIATIIFGYIVPVAFYLTIICVFISKDYIGYQALFPIFLFVTHRLMIAFKYATLSPTEYRRIMRGHNISRKEIDYFKLPTQEEIDTVLEYQVQLQLLTGWLPINNYRIVYEFVAASLICVADINSSFIIPDPSTSTENELQFQRWKNLLNRNELIENLKKDNERNVYKLDLLTFCNCIMRENRNCLTGLAPIMVILSFVNAIIPFLFVIDTFSTLHIYAQVYYISSGLISVIFYWAICSFLLAALEDSTRRYLCSETLSHFIRAIDVDSKFKFRFHTTDQTHKLLRCESSQLQQAINESNQFRLSVSETSFTSSSPKFRKHSSFEIQSPTTCVPIPQNPLLNTNSLFSSLTTSTLQSPTSTSQLQSQSSSIPTNNGITTYMDISCRTIPILNLTDYPDNIIVWIYARKLLHNFGTRIRFRLDTYCGGIILLLFTLVVSILYIIFTSPHPSSSSSSSRLDTLSSPGFIQLILWIVVFTLFQAAMIALGHFTNKTMESHGYVLSQHILLVTREINQLKEQITLYEDTQQLQSINKRLETLNICLTTMKNTLSACEVMDFVQPVRVLGIKCEGRTAVVMVYTLFLFLIGIIQYINSGDFSV